MKTINARFLVYCVALTISLVVSCHLISVDAKHKSKKKSKAASSSLPTTTAPQSSSKVPSGDPSNSKTFSVLSYGAKGGGSSDDTPAFLAAWKAACPVANSVVLVPAGSVFLLGPLTFDGGDCKGITFQVDGTLLASTDPSAWSAHPLQWINIEHVTGITITGTGKFKGQGEVWWSGGKMPSTKPTALRFGGCTGVVVTGISIVDSQQAHLKFDDCTGVEAHHITINSPADSPNTDGIHVQGSKNVHLHDATVACGDDCISIQTGSSGINIEGITCGPSHGISIGSLGQNGVTACVKGVTVSGCTVTDSDNGFRIKSLPDGDGSVSGVSVRDLTVSNVKVALKLDQHYGCNDGGSCKASSVAVSGISFVNVRGTYSLYPADFECGEGRPCTDITLSQIELTPIGGGNEVAVCQYATGTVVASGTSVAHCLDGQSPKSSYDQYFLDSKDEGGSC